MGKTIGLILAAGLGVRFGAGQPKQYFKILGKELIAYSVEAFQKALSLDDFYVVLNDDPVQQERIEEQYGVKIIPGGETRNESFRKALDYLKANVSDCEKIFVNEAARPMITPEIINNYVKKLDEFDYVYSAEKITDSLGTIDNKFADRSKFILVRAPEAYHFRQIESSFSADMEITFPGHSLPKELKAYQYFEYNNNIKVTFISDVNYIQHLLINNPYLRA